MTDTGLVQEGAGGVANLASPADPAAYMQQAASGSRYVEFNVPADSLSPGEKAGWATIRGPNPFILGSLWPCASGDAACNRHRVVDRALVAFYVSSGARASELLPARRNGVDAGRQVFRQPAAQLIEIQRQYGWTSSPPQRPHG